MSEKMRRFIWETAAIGSWCIVRSAIEKQGYSVNLRDCKSNTFLHHAAMVGTIEQIDYFMENGIDINSTNEDGCTPLHMAAQYGCFLTVKHLVEKGADLNALNKNDYNPFHVASQHGNYEIAAYLKWVGTDQDTENYTWRDKFRPRANCKSPVKAQPGNHASS